MRSLNGQKTYVGVAIWAIASILEGLYPEWAAVLAPIKAGALGLAGIGAAHKLAKAGVTAAAASGLLCLVMLTGCASGKDAVREINQDHQRIISATAGDASTDPVNFDPLTMVGASGNLGDFTAEPIDISSRTHNPQAGWNLVAALLSDGGGSALEDPMLDEYREDVRVLRAVWMDDVESASKREALDQALAIMAEYIVSNPPKHTDWADVTLPTQYHPTWIIFNLAGADETVATKAVEKLPDVVTNSRVEYVDEAAEEEAPEDDG